MNKLFWMVSLAFPQNKCVWYQKQIILCKSYKKFQKKKDKLGFRLYDAPSDLRKQRAVKSQFGQQLVQETG